MLVKGLPECLGDRNGLLRRRVREGAPITSPFVVLPLIWPSPAGSTVPVVSDGPCLAAQVLARANGRLHLREVYWEEGSDKLLMAGSELVVWIGGYHSAELSFNLYNSRRSRSTVPHTIPIQIIQRAFPSAGLVLETHTAELAHVLFDPKLVVVYALGPVCQPRLRIPRGQENRHRELAIKQAYELGLVP